MSDIAIPAADLRRFCAAVLERVGLSAAEAALIADHLVEANLRGVDSHGVQRLPVYVKRMELGVWAKETRPVVVRERAASVLLDARAGSGIVAAMQAMHMAMDKARSVGIGLAGVRGSNHCGALAYYTLRMAEQDFIAMAMTNGPSQMPPWGGREKYLGTNPISFAIPAGQERPIVLDMATSLAARGKIILAAKSGKPIPPGWALDRDGNPTTDSRAALEGLVAPMAGPKGYGLAVIIDILSGIFTGSAFGREVGELYGGWDRPQNVGHFFLALRPDLFVTMEEFKAEVDRMIRQVREVPRAAGVERILLPGEPEFETRAWREAGGVPTPAEVAAELADLGRQYGVEPSWNV